MPWNVLSTLDKVISPQGSAHSELCDVFDHVLLIFDPLLTHAVHAILNASIFAIMLLLKCR
jgi:hypothetical protein